MMTLGRYFDMLIVLNLTNAKVLAIRKYIVTEGRTKQSVEVASRLKIKNMAGEEKTERKGVFVPIV